MTISSRTPEGQPNRCLLCGSRVWLEPSQPPGDAPCPYCGTLLWFMEPSVADGGTQPKNHIRVTRGTFAGLEGTIEAVLGPRDEDAVLGPRSIVRVVIQIFGRPVPVELQTEDLELVRT